MTSISAIKRNAEAIVKECDGNDGKFVHGDYILEKVKKILNELPVTYEIVPE